MPYHATVWANVLEPGTSDLCDLTKGHHRTREEVHAILKTEQSTSQHYSLGLNDCLRDLVGQGDFLALWTHTRLLLRGGATGQA